MSKCQVEEGTREKKWPLAKENPAAQNGCTIGSPGFFPGPRARSDLGACFLYEIALYTKRSCE